MTSSTVRVACCQTEPVVGAKSENLKKIDGLIAEATHQGAQVIVLPELANCGYSFASHAELAAEAEPVDGHTVNRWRALSDELGIVIVGGYAERDANGHFYNSAVLVSAGGAVNYRKAHLWNSEKDIFTPGDEAPRVVATPFGAISLMICYDLEFPEWVREPSLSGAELLCAPVNWPLYPRPVGERPSEIFRIQANASVNRIAIAAADRTGDDREANWLGGSVIVNADGFPLSLAELGSSGIIIADVDLLDSRSKGISEQNNVHEDRRVDLYSSTRSPGR